MKQGPFAEYVKVAVIEVAGIGEAVSALAGADPAIVQAGQPVLVEARGPLGGLNSALNKLVIDDKGDKRQHRNGHPPRVEEVASPQQPGDRWSGEHANEPPVANSDEQFLAAV